jgi:sugar phosphate isomerase/epimerase
MNPLFGLIWHRKNVYLAAFSLQHHYHFSQRALEFLEKVGNDNGNATADTCHAVHEDIRLSSCLFDKIKGLIEKPIDVVL